jgi:arabinose-5-phosphate isomerase
MMTRPDPAAPSSAEDFPPLDRLRFGREILQTEAQALAELAGRLGGSFCGAIELIHACAGSVIVTGMGKAGLIGRKIAATLGSTGTRAHWLHPAEAVHGDLGRVHADDVVLVLSQSGETEEVVRLLPTLAELGVDVIAITARGQSTLGRAASVVIELGSMPEADALGLAPSTSTTAMLAVGDALALVTSRLRGFRREDFARFHPGGSLGLKLSRVDQHMRAASQCRIASADRSVREVLVGATVPGRRSGAIMLIDADGRLAGLFTDSDLARLVEQRREAQLDRPMRQVMTAGPLTCPTGTMLEEAMALMAERKISELPVIDADGRPVGMLDVTDLVGLWPREPGEKSTTDGSASGPRGVYPEQDRRRRA